jgi:diacylglycerol kinase
VAREIDTVDDHREDHEASKIAKDALGTVFVIIVSFVVFATWAVGP